MTPIKIKLPYQAEMTNKSYSHVLSITHMDTKDNQLYNAFYYLVGRAIHIYNIDKHYTIKTLMKLLTLDNTIGMSKTMWGVLNQVYVLSKSLLWYVYSADNYRDMTIQDALDIIDNSNKVNVVCKSINNMIKYYYTWYERTYHYAPDHWGVDIDAIRYRLTHYDDYDYVSDICEDVYEIFIKHAPHWTMTHYEDIIMSADELVKNIHGWEVNLRDEFAGFIFVFLYDLLNDAEWSYDYVDKYNKWLSNNLKATVFINTNCNMDEFLSIQVELE